MRYAVRRLRRKLPQATIILGCWMKHVDAGGLERLRDGARADLVAARLGEAVKLCIELARADKQSDIAPKPEQLSATTAA
jgi:hypothetical protein